MKTGAQMRDTRGAAFATTLSSPRERAEEGAVVVVVVVATGRAHDVLCRPIRLSSLPTGSLVRHYGAHSHASWCPTFPYADSASPSYDPPFFFSCLSIGVGMAFCVHPSTSPNSARAFRTLSPLLCGGRGKRVFERTFFSSALPRCLSSDHTPHLLQLFSPRLPA